MARKKLLWLLQEYLFNTQYKNFHCADDMWNMSEEAPNITSCTYSKAKDWRKLDKNGKRDFESASASLKNNCAQVEDVSYATTCSNKIISICMAPIKIRYQNTGKELNRCAPLYSWSQGTLIRKEIANTLGNSGYATQISVKTFNGNQIYSSVAVENLEVARNDIKYK